MSPFLFSHKRSLRSLRWRSLRCGLPGLLLLVFGLICAKPQEAASVETRVKAAFLLNFAKFVEWPAVHEKHPLCIGVLGKDPFGPVLDEIMTGKMIDGKPVQIKRLKQPSEASDCQILFVSNSERKRFTQIVSQMAARPVLTVSDVEDFTREGGMIRLFLDGNNFRFEVNLTAVEEGQIKLSSKLLHLGRVVRFKPPEAAQ